MEGGVWLRWRIVASDALGGLEDVVGLRTATALSS